MWLIRSKYLGVISICGVLLLLPWQILNALTQLEPVEFCAYYPGKHFSPIKSGPSNPAFLAVRSMSEWSEVWNRLHPLPLRPSPSPSGQEAADSHQPEREPAPLIDFTKYTLVIAGSGDHSSSGFAVAFTQIYDDRFVIQVKVFETSPGKECVVVGTPTSPIALALIPRTDRTIVFDIAEVQVGCSNHEIKRIEVSRPGGSPH